MLTLKSHFQHSVDPGGEKEGWVSVIEVGGKGYVGTTVCAGSASQLLV